MQSPLTLSPSHRLRGTLRFRVKGKQRREGFGVCTVARTGSLVWSGQWSGHGLLSSSERGSGEAVTLSPLEGQSGSREMITTAAGCSPPGMGELAMGCSICKAWGSCHEGVHSLVSESKITFRGEEGKCQRSKVEGESDKVQVVRLTTGPFFTVTVTRGLTEQLLTKK